MRQLALLACCLLSLATTGAEAQNRYNCTGGTCSPGMTMEVGGVAASTANPLPTLQTQPVTQILGTKAGAGDTTGVIKAPVGPWTGGAYDVSCGGTWAGASVGLLALQPNGKDFSAATDSSGTSVSWSSSATQKTINIGQGAIIRPQITGGTSPSLWCVASGYSSTFVAGAPTIPGQGADTIPLAPLTLSASSFTIGAVSPGSVVGTIGGTVAGASVSFVPSSTGDAGKLAVTGDTYAGGWQLVIGSTPTTAGQPVTGNLVQTRPSGTLSTPVTITAVFPTLQQLNLDGYNFAPGAASGTAIGNVVGKTAGTTLSLSLPPGSPDAGTVQRSGAQIQVAAGSATARNIPIILIETLYGSSRATADGAAGATDLFAADAADL